MDKMRDTIMTGSVECLKDDGGISTVALRNYIQTACERNGFVFDGVCPKTKFKDAGDFVMKGFEDCFYETCDTYEYILENEDLSREGRLVVRRSVSELGGLYLRARNLNEISYNRGVDDTEIAPVELTGYASRFVEYLRSVIPKDIKSDIRLVRGARKDLMCAANGTLLTLILVNFVHNAFRHSRSEDGRLDIAVSRIKRHNRAALSVIDHGIGVDVKKLRGIMERNIVSAENGFIKFRKYQGCGLIACKRLADSMNGKIIVGNMAGGGAVFTLLLPESDTIKGRIPPLVNDKTADGGIEKKLIKIVMQNFARYD